ncbi:MAG: hypothetical protein HYU66_24860 [Armatimonadetes bacterium]|nr:hypothetical protein [Armatimonadota bacterium]
MSAWPWLPMLLLAGEPGLVGVRFNSANFDRPWDLNVVAVLDLDTGTTINDYSALYFGRLSPAWDGDVLLRVEADNGARVWLDDRLALDAWDTGSAETALQARRDTQLKLRVEYFQSGGSGRLRLLWGRPGEALVPVPAAGFSHTDTDRRDAEQARGAVPTVDIAAARLYGTDPAETLALPVPAQPGPHLLLDDALIASAENVTRRVDCPVRDPAIPNPVVTGREDGCFQPYFTVQRDPASGRFRIWYGAAQPDQHSSRSRIGYLEAADGIHWERPARYLPQPGDIQFGCEVVDRGAEFQPADERYTFSYYLDGLRIGVSADGLAFRPLVDRVVLRHNHDIDNVAWDALRGRWVATVSVYIESPQGIWRGLRRVTCQSFSDDRVHWQPPWPVLAPRDDIDEGETQFYAMAGYLTRGPLTIGMVKVLRDDLKADVPPNVVPEAYGLGYTALAWTRDGRTWYRDRTPFFERDPRPAAWDHAHAWVDEQVPVGGRVYLYYGGYKQGHKVNRFEERQIGLVTMPRDRYVARVATGLGRLATVPFRLGDAPSGLSLNAAGGAIRVQVADEQGRPLPGLTFGDCRAVTGDGLDLAVSWGAAGDRAWAGLAGRVVRLEFELRDAALYAFDLTTKEPAAGE